MSGQINNLFMFAMPFANEIANAVTIGGGGRFKRLYKPCSTDIITKIKSSIIDTIALYGIIWNVAFMADKHGVKKACSYGLSVILLSYIIPNLFMEYTIERLPRSSEKYVRILGLLGFIFVLFLSEIMFHELILKY